MAALRNGGRTTHVVGFFFLVVYRFVVSKAHL